jgi:hypothetical protein
MPVGNERQDGMGPIIEGHAPIHAKVAVNPNTKVFRVRGGPQGSFLRELRLGNQNLLENAFGFDVSASVDGMVELTVKYRLIEVVAELETGRTKHELMLQKTIWRTNPVDGVLEKTPHREHLTVTVTTSLADALREMADKVEKEGG